MSSLIFPAAVNARNSTYRDVRIHQEVREIEKHVLQATADGYYQTIISNGTIMTNSSQSLNDIWSIDPQCGTIEIPNHGFRMGEAIFVSSSGTLPAPLAINTVYYVIYIDPNHINLASSYTDAMSGTPVSIDFSTGLMNITITNPGSGYLVAPNVQIIGGNAQNVATASATLSESGDLISVSVLTPGSYTDVPDFNITSTGSNATISSVVFSAISLSIVSAGVNYRVGDVIIAQGGVGTPTTASVTAVDNSGAVQAVSLNNPGAYTTLPELVNGFTVANPSIGTGCTLSLNMGISNLIISSGGFGYVANPSVLIQGGSGQGASAIAQVYGGSVVSTKIINAGQNYTSQPNVTITSGEGAELLGFLNPSNVASISIPTTNLYNNVPELTIVPNGSGLQLGNVMMQVVSCTLQSPGMNYNAGDVLNISGGLGSLSGVIYVNSVNIAGQILTYSLITSGIYSILPPSTNLPQGGSGSGAQFILNFGVESIQILNQGSGYTSPPTILFNGNGTGAYATPFLENGSVSNILITPGQNFTTVPTISMTNGFGASAVVNLVPSPVIITVVDGGTGYSNLTVYSSNIVIGTGVIDNGVVTSVTTSNLINYSSAPVCTFDGDGTGFNMAVSLENTPVQNVQIINQGAYYTSAPQVYINGSLSNATSQLVPTGLSSVQIVNGGQYYNSHPTITTTNNGSGGVFCSHLGYSISSINIVNQGSYYQSTPTINISSPQILSGVQATANAIIGIGSGTLSLQRYYESHDYYLVWKNQTPLDPNRKAPYSDHMNTVMNYFTGLGYTILQQTNPQTQNTMQWSIKW